MDPDNYGGRTEWEDQMIRLGHMKAPEPTVSEETLIEMIEKAAQDYTKEPSKEEKLEKATLDELDELEDDEDDAILQKYRQQRMGEMKAQALRNRYGIITEIKAPEWTAEVTNAASDVHVIIHLYKPGVPQCQIVNTLLVKLANKYKDVKFLRAVSDETIPNYPDKNLPTLLIYKGGDIVCQMIGLTQMGGTEKDLIIEELEYHIGKLGGAWTPADKKPTRDFKLSRQYRESHFDESDDEY